MYIIDKENNQLRPIRKATFRELGFREREHLQEWIAKYPNCLGEELLIIQKEFDGFNETNERLDLLAVDKTGSLVIIENKLDDTGKDVTWQVIKYASYCSTLSSSDIIKIFNEYLIQNSVDESAEDILEEFLETEDYKELLNTGNTQRILMVAGDFRKEVTSSVMWLMNYGLRIQCFKASPFVSGDDIILNMEQIVPIKEAEDYVISMAKKNREESGEQDELKERHIIRRDFWGEMLKGLAQVTGLFKNVSPRTAHWMGAGSGTAGITYNLVATKKYMRIELTISGGTQEENKEWYDKLLADREAIERRSGNTLEWERLDGKRMSRIKYEKTDLSVFRKEDWPAMIEFVTDHINAFESAFKKYLK